MKIKQDKGRFLFCCLPRPVFPSPARLPPLFRNSRAMSIIDIFSSFARRSKCAIIDCEDFAGVPCRKISAKATNAVAALPPPRFAAAVQGRGKRKKRFGAICYFTTTILDFQSIIPQRNFAAPDRGRECSRLPGKTFSNVWSNDPEGLGK